MQASRRSTSIPGIGFGKGTRDNLALLARLDELCRAAHDEGFGVLVGASRKRFLGVLPHGPALDAEDRFEGSLAVATLRDGLRRRRGARP